MLTECYQFEKITVRANSFRFMVTDCQTLFLQRGHLQLVKFVRTMKETLLQIISTVMVHTKVFLLTTVKLYRYSYKCSCYLVLVTLSVESIGMGQ